MVYGPVARQARQQVLMRRHRGHPKRRPVCRPQCVTRDCLLTVAKPSSLAKPKRPGTPGRSLAGRLWEALGPGQKPERPRGWDHLFPRGVVAQVGDDGGLDLGRGGGPGVARDD